MRGRLLTPPNDHVPLTEGWVDEGEAQGAQLLKKPRWREEGSEVQWKGQSLKGETSAPI